MKSGADAPRLQGHARGALDGTSLKDGSMVYSGIGPVEVLRDRKTA
ncbi:MAG TPA: hypothetical protein VN280_18785 [Variovorax sp.]|nr:hypothetical protein [Variovorax sp.]